MQFWWQRKQLLCVNFELVPVALCLVLHLLPRREEAHSSIPTPANVFLDSSLPFTLLSLSHLLPVIRSKPSPRDSLPSTASPISPRYHSGSTNTDTHPHTHTLTAVAELTFTSSHHLSRNQRADALCQSTNSSTFRAIRAEG